MNKKTTDAVIEHSDDSLGLPILGGCTRIGKTEHNAVAFKMTAQSVIVEFLPIVGLQDKERELELSKHIGMKCKEAR